MGGGIAIILLAAGDMGLHHIWGVILRGNWGKHEHERKVHGWCSI